MDTLILGRGHRKGETFKNGSTKAQQIQEKLKL